MAKKALCLSGGGARGSFQIGAIKCLYEVYGFRPDVIAGTSVGAVNGIKLAAAPPLANNDSESILIAVRNGQIDKQLKQAQELEKLWFDFISPVNFFKVREPFLGTRIEEAVNKLNDPDYSAPLYTKVTTQIDLLSAGMNVLVFFPIIGQIVSGVATAELQKIRYLIEKISTENALLELSPIENLLRDNTNLNIEDLTNGTPLYLAMVSLETGKLRYVTNKGEFYERDSVTPVATALMDSDIDAALDENLNPLIASRKNIIKFVVASYKEAVNRIATYRAEYNTWNTKEERRRRLAEMIQREADRGNYYARAAKAQIKGVRITAKVDPILAVLGSACMPAYFNPPMVGVERYVDGGVREIIPVEVALRHHIDQLVGIVCSANELSETDSMEKAGVMAVAMRSLIDIALKEVVVGDLATVGSEGIDVRYIIPAFDVHDTVVVQPSLIEISMHYGWLRTVDEMHLAPAGDRKVFRQSSELIARLRLKCLEVERRVPTDDYRIASTHKWDYFELRVYRWAIMHILARRNTLGLPAHSTQSSWTTAWEREFRGTWKLFFGSVWDKLEARSADNSFLVELWPSSSPENFSPDTSAIQDAGSDRIYRMVRGAIFEDKSESPLAPIILPDGTHQYLPRIPRGMHLMAETQASSTIYLVARGKKYSNPTPQIIAAARLTGSPVALVPTGGMAQIPDGGVPSFLASISVVDDRPDHLLSEVVIERVEHSNTTADVYLYNRSANKLTGLSIRAFKLVNGIRENFDTEAGVSIERAPINSEIGANAVDFVILRLQPTRAGEYNGFLEIQSSDPVFPSLTVEMKVNILPLGDMANLVFSPSPLEINARVNSTTSYAMLTVTNTGVVSPSMVSAFIEPTPAQSLFVLGSRFNTSDFSPGHAVQMPVFFYPLARGRFNAALLLTVDGNTSNNHQYQQTVRIPLVGNARAPKISLSRMERPRPLRPGAVRPVPPILRDPGDPGVVTFDPLPTKLTIDLGTVQPPVNNAASFFIYNSGDLALEVTAIRAKYASIAPNANLTFPLTIAPNEQREIKLDLGVYASPSIGRFSEMIRIECDDPMTPQASVILNGAVGGPKCKINPEYIDFSVVPVDSSVKMSATLENVGTVDLNIKLAWQTREQGDPFNFVEPPQMRLAVGKSMVLEIVFLSSTPGPYTNVLSVKTAEGASAGLRVQAQAI